MYVGKIHFSLNENFKPYTVEVRYSFIQDELWLMDFFKKCVNNAIY